MSQPAAPVAGTAVADPVINDDLVRLKVIAMAKERGLTWAQIGAGLGMTGREAKRHTHHLARKCQRQVVTKDAAAAAG
jgi:hypothetical protein